MRPAQADTRQIGIWTGLKHVYAHMSASRRGEFATVLGLMLVGALAELGTIGSVIPFLALLSSGTTARLPLLTTIFASLGETLPGGRIGAAAIVFAAFAMFSGLIRLALAWRTQHFIFRLAHELAVESQRRILFQPYSFHIQRNSSSLMSATAKTEVLAFDLVLPLMQTAIAAFIGAVLVIGLLFIEPVMTVAAAAAFSAVYLVVSAVTGKRLAANSTVVGSAYEQRIKVVQESLGGIRDVIIDSSQLQHLEIFEEVDGRLGLARATTNFMATAPRFLVESLGMVVIAAIIVIVSERQGGIGLALPSLGALALGAQRLLPLVQTVYSGWSLASGHRSIVGQVVETLELPLPEERPDTGRIAVSKRIQVERVSFTYPGRKQPALEDVSFDLPAGTMLALCGKTGSGKSTLADVLMGLLQPTQGRVCIDGVHLTPGNAPEWQRNLSHVPQSIFLADTTIGRNIALAFDREPLDLPRIVASAAKAQLHQFVQSLPLGYDTMVGERGIRLSGGQRQRLGLARAIYKDAPVLVLDEATSALDELTESAVIRSLEELRRQGRTIVVIAHRHSTIRQCDLIARLEDGRLVEFGPLAAVLGTGGGKGRA
jgi:ATP-binding cassette, subfamily B, bacterial PglK